MLELALVRWALEKLRGHGFEPVVPPVLVRERALYGTGFLPDTEQQIYSVPEDELFLVGTSEVALASLHDGEIIDAERLPLRYAGFSPCFRREAGAAGKDTRGIFSVHQFDKVEMFSFVAPEDSADEHERILAIEEEILRELGLPYRVVNIAVSDLGSSAAKKYDCEAWMPSQGRYRELTSCSNTTDYQARRLNIRVRSEQAHTDPAHAQRHGGRGRAHDRRAARERPARRRRRGAAEPPGALWRTHGPASRRLDNKHIKFAATVKLVRGRTGVDELKRTTILEAMAETMAQRAAAGADVTVTEVIARSGVSSAAFHEAFADREACVLAAFDLGLVRAHRRMASAYQAEARWLEAIKAALAAFLQFLEDEPELGRLLVVHSTGAGEQVLRRRAQVLGALAAIVDRGRLEGPAGKQQPPAVIAEGVVGAVLAVIQNRLLADQRAALLDLFGSLVSIIVLPYLGVGVARRELARPAPRLRSGPAMGSTAVVAPSENGGGVRLTYRTARVLSAIADYPGASNREVADRAGIVDQGQISKLLGRLGGAPADHEDGRGPYARCAELVARHRAWRAGAEDGVRCREPMRAAQLLCL